MAETAGELSFAFTADLTGLTRAAADAGKTLDDLGRKAATWSGEGAAALSKPFDDAVAGPLRLSSAMTRAARGDDDGTATKELSHLADQLALLKTTGAAHDAILERMTIETDQAKLGADATQAQKEAVASLVEQIDAATAAQAQLASAQAATDTAWRSGSSQIAKGIESVVLGGASLRDAGRSLLTGFARQGLDGALTGTGAFAGLFGTKGSGGQVGGLFGAIESLFGGGLAASGGASATAALPNFAGLYANGGSIDAGQWGIVGEKGAEVVAGPATVVPMNRMAANPAPATQQTINFNVTSPDAPSFARSQDQMSALLSRLVARGQRNA